MTRLTISPDLVGDVYGVIDGLQLRCVHYWGWSMSGDLAFALAQAIPERLEKVIIGGACSPPAREPDKPDEFREGVEQGGAAGLVEVWKQHLPISAALPARLRQLDMEAISADLRAPRTGLQSVPSTMSMPCLM
jgi:pimeloyl-ACP methyl ester carboxylesterase